jgi:hypothetical protein
MSQDRLPGEARGEPDHNAEGTADAGSSSSVLTDPGTVAVYEALANKWISTRSLAYQFPALTLAAQAFLIAAATQPTPRPIFVDIFLSGAILLIGVVSGLMQIRTGQESHLDLTMLDHLEALLLSERRGLRLWHSLPLEAREERLLEAFSDAEIQSYLWIFASRGKWPRLNIKVTLGWAVLQTIVSLAGATIALVV